MCPTGRRAASPLLSPSPRYKRQREFGNNALAHFLLNLNPLHPGQLCKQMPAHPRPVSVGQASRRAGRGLWDTRMATSQLLPDRGREGRRSSRCAAAGLDQAFTLKVTRSPAWGGGRGVRPVVLLGALCEPPEPAQGCCPRWACSRDPSKVWSAFPPLRQGHEIIKSDMVSLGQSLQVHRHQGEPCWL